MPPIPAAEAVLHGRAGARDVTVAAHTRAVEGAIRTMRSRLQEVLTLQDLASVACLSPAHFSRVFRRLIGVPPIEYLTALRFQRARQLLLMTSPKSTDICFEVGFTSPGTFTSRFTYRVGLSPRQLHLRAQAFESAPAVMAARRPEETTGASARPPPFAGRSMWACSEAPFRRASPHGVPHSRRQDRGVTCYQTSPMASTTCARQRFPSPQISSRRCYRPRSSCWAIILDHYSCARASSLAISISPCAHHVSATRRW